MMVMIHCRHRVDLVRHHVVRRGRGRSGGSGWFDVLCCVGLVEMAPVLFYFILFYFLIHEHINVTYIINITVVI